MGRLTIVVAAGLLGLSCSKKKAPNEAKPEPIPSGAKRSAPKPPKDVRFALEKDFKRAARVFEVGSAAIVCASPCAIKKGPPNQTWLVDESGIREDPKLWPGKGWRRDLRNLEEEGFEDGLPITFWGEYPQVHAGAFTGSRMGETLPALSFRNAEWVENPLNRPEEETKLPPRRYDAALVTAPIKKNPIGRLVYGAGGPTLLTSPKQLHVHQDAAWASRPAPWGNDAYAQRLEGGSTLVLSNGGVHLISKDLEVKAVKVGGGATPAKLTLVSTGKTLRLAASKGQLRLYRPANALALEPHVPAKREKPSPKRVLAVPADSERKHAPPKAAQGEMPASTRFSRKCKTPFVLLEKGLAIGIDYSSTGKGLSGEIELGTKLTFVEFLRGNTGYFGAQAKDETSARQLIAVLKKKIPGMKPKLRCLDAVGHIGDPYTAMPTQLGVVFLHLGSGARLRLP